ncbi:MAG: uroporphyrinogen decarboxylase [Proteobacteria bacterium]|nr:MAG: uroporphyrinogen decarboxylase [Pseudomonadota bacterium]
MDPTERLLAACRRQPVDRPPVWIMRQAGRYMASYRAVRARASFMELCRTPRLACDVTLMPIDQLGVDAAILFSDILVPLEGMGLEVYFDSKGPHVSPPARTAADVEGLRVEGAADAVGYVYDAVALIKRELDGRVPLLGFAGAPLTLATYAVEGGTTKHKHELLRLLYDAPEALHALLGKLTDVVIDYLGRQVDAGADAVQVFDTWGGQLTLEQWRLFSQPYTARIFEALRAKDVPTIHYALGGAHLLEGLAELPCDVLSVDWRQPLSYVRQRTGGRYALQGNVDPGVLRACPDVIHGAVRACLEDFGRNPGHILNLGHGITPDVTVDAARSFVEAARAIGPELGTL